MMEKVQCPLEAMAQKNPDAIAVITSEQIFTFEELNEVVESNACRLKETGIQRGERVSITSQNRVEYLILLTALWRIGAIACFVSTRLPREAIEMLAAELDCRRNLERAIKFDTRKSTQSIIGIPIDQDATIMYTSGSSSIPKAALHTFGNHYFSAIGANENIPFQSGDRWLLSLPLYHVGGLSIYMRSLIGGGAVVIPDLREDILRSINQYEVTHLSLVSTQLQRLLRKGGASEACKKLKAILVGGGPISHTMVTESLSRDWPVYITYGLTEMSSQVATSTADNIHQKNVRSAKILNYSEVKLSNGNEIMVRGRTLFKGYVEKQNLIKPFNSEGWYATGDLGRFVDTDRIKVFGRKDNMFISGGENIQPEEIEQHLCQLGFVEEAVIVPRFDEEFGFRPVAFLRTNTDLEMEENKIRSFLEQLLPKFKVPDRFYLWPNSNAQQGLKLNRQYFRNLIRNTKTYH